MIYAKVIRGHGVASGKGKDRRYPRGTLFLQLPYFADLGLDLTHYFRGTINIDIRPYHFEIRKPAYRMEGIKWSTHIPAENFFFFDAEIIHEEISYEGYIYMPDPETKTDHFQPLHMLELIMPEVLNLKYGSTIELKVKPPQIRLYKN